jgi:hypothetical protein
LNESYAAFLKGSFLLGLNGHHAILLEDPKGILNKNIHAEFEREGGQSWKKSS